MGRLPLQSSWPTRAFLILAFLVAFGIPAATGEELPLNELLRNDSLTTSKTVLAFANLSGEEDDGTESSQSAVADIEQAGEIVEQARAMLLKAAFTQDDAVRIDLSSKVRRSVVQAREQLQRAHGFYKQRRSEFPAIIPASEKQRIAERDAVEIRYIQTLLDLAQCRYLEAQTYPKSNSRFVELTKQAAEQYEKIYTDYRSQIGGLRARLCQGKCLEQLDETVKALGVYERLLEQRGSSAAIQVLKDEALQFQLSCLNHPKQKQYQQVIEDATRWLDDNAQKRNTRAGVGIRWERCRAAHMRGNDATRTASSRKRSLKLALLDATEVSRFTGSLQEASRLLASELREALDRDITDAKDFQEAYEQSQNLVSHIDGFNGKIAAAADQSTAATLRAKLNDHLSTTTVLLERALALIEPDSDPATVASARYLLAYVYYLTGRNYESAVLAGFVAKHFQAEDSELPLDAAYLAMAAFVQAYEKAPKNDRAAELKLMVTSCEDLTSRWPESDKANEARMALGWVHSRQNEPVAAGRWYSQIPSTAKEYTAAQLAAGQAYWTAYLKPPQRTGAAKPLPAELNDWLEKAWAHLRAGIEREQPQPSEGAAFDEWIAAKVSLSQILVRAGEYADAIRLLDEGDQSVMRAIKVSDETTRPKSGIKSRSFASLCHQLLLRCFVETQQVDRALRQMKELEKVVGAAEGADVTEIYVKLGRDIQKEMQRLLELGEQDRIVAIRTSFDRFLEELDRHKKEMNYAALVWIAETYFGLGKGMGDDHEAEAHAYFQKAAATYSKILSRDEFPADRKTAVMLRLINCRRRQNEFAEAVESMRLLLEDRPKSLALQFEAAAIYQDWGSSGQPDASDQLLRAINGDADKPVNEADEEVTIWGWAGIAKRLGRILNSGQHSQTKQSDYREKFLDARYHISECRRAYGLQQSNKQIRLQALDAAKQEIEALALLSSDVATEWKDKFNGLYAATLRDSGKPVSSLSWSVDVAPDTSPPLASAKITPQPPPTTKTIAQSAAASPRVNRSGSDWTLVALISAFCAAGVVVFLMRRPPRTARVSSRSSAGRSGHRVKKQQSR